MKLIHFIGASIGVSVLMAAPSFAVPRLNDDKFQLLASTCLNNAVAQGIKMLKYKTASGVGLNLSGGYGGAEVGIGFNIPRTGLNKSEGPGDGICCTFDKVGKIKTVHQTIKGNDECGAKVRTTPGALGAGLWWCTGPQDNCSFDWWYIEP